MKKEHTCANRHKYTHSTFNVHQAFIFLGVTLQSFKVYLVIFGFSGFFALRVALQLQSGVIIMVYPGITACVIICLEQICCP